MYIKSKEKKNERKLFENKKKISNADCRYPNAYLIKYLFVLFSIYH